MKRLCLTTILLLSTAAPAFSQAEMMMLGLCRRIKDDTARLKCFDAIGQSTDKTTDTAPAPKAAQEWSVTDSKSPIDDSPQVMALLLSEDGDGSLMLRCKEKKIEAAITAKGMFVSERGTVLMRLNDLPPATATWSAAQNSQAVFAPNGTALLSALPDGGTLFTRITGYSRSNDVTFKLGNVTAVKDRIVAACKQPEKRPAAAPKAVFPQ